MISTFTQIYEWESVVDIIEEQKYDTMEETLSKMRDEEHKNIFLMKE
jgi:hypothetical protein